MTNEHTVGAGSGYFGLLSADEQRDAIRRLARSGMGDHTISSITEIGVEGVRRILAERGCDGCDGCDE
jgi:hypothetical protein